MKSDIYQSLPLRRIGKLIGGGTPKSDATNWDGSIPFVTPPDLRPVNGGLIVSTDRFLTEEGAAAGSSVVPTDSVLLSIRAPIGYVARTGMRAAFNQGCRAIQPSKSIDSRYLTYALVAAGPELASLGRGTTFMELSTTQMAALEVPVPQLAKQRIIADYLDRETIRIDTLIGEQKCLIEMLRERRRSVASDLLGHRVGRGMRLKWYFDEIDRRAGDEADMLPLMSVSISWGVRRRDEVTDDESRAENLTNYKVCRRGELVINRMRAFQGGLGLAPEDGLVSPDYAVLRVRHEIDSDWLAASMKTGAFVSEMSQRVKGIGSADLGSARTPRINISDLAEIRIGIPQVKEQKQEAMNLRAQTAKVDTLILETERFIELSKERRSALITAAVTGQIDVQEMV